MVKSEEEMRQFDVSFLPMTDQITYYKEKIKKKLNRRKPIFSENPTHMENERNQRPLSGIERSQPSGDKD